uniref:integrator complex subunit 12 isoform X2 n=1 Tax=Myxine glutinosa TaxID=7769 RepID=UPI00358E6A6D
MAGPPSDLEPVFIRALSYLRSKSRDSADKLKALLDEALLRSGGVLGKELDIIKPATSKGLPASRQESKISQAGLGLRITITTDKQRKDGDRKISEKPMHLDDADVLGPAKRARLERLESRSSPVPSAPNRDLLVDTVAGQDETNADEFAMEMGLACVVCRQVTVSPGNQLVECQDCHNLYHQDCHRPSVSDKEANDPRLAWYCQRCARQIKKLNQKTSGKPGAVAGLGNAKDASVKKMESRPTSDLFQAFKRSETKVSSSSPHGSLTFPQSGGPPSAVPATSSSTVGGLAGWAANFGAKTSSAGPVASAVGGKFGFGSGTTIGSKVTPGSAKVTKTGVQPKLGMVVTSSSGKCSPPVPSLKVEGYRAHALEGKRLGVLSTVPSGRNSPGLVSSGGSVFLSSALGTVPVSAVGMLGAVGSSNNSGASGGITNLGNNGSNVSASKTPTSQESQLNAMRRLQLVKKKAQQKKMKK